MEIKKHRMRKKTRNATKICKALWQHPRDSRIDLSKRLGLDKSTVTSEISELIKAGVICELPKQDTVFSSSGTGRKPIPLAISKDYGIVLGLSIQAGSYSLVVVDLVGNMVFSKDVEESITQKNAIESITRIYEDFVKNLSKDAPRCFGMGIGFGGLINQEDSSVQYSVPLDITEKFTFLDEIKRRIPVTVTLENNANCCAWAQLAFLHDTAHKNFLFILLEFKQVLVPHQKYGGVGIGLGIVINGKIYHGTNSFAGEFRSAFCKENNDEQMSISKEEMNKILENPVIFTRFIEELAANIAMFANTLDIGEVFVGSDMESQGRAFCKALEEAISRNWIFPVEKEVPIKYSSYGSGTIAYGATGKLIQTLFDSGIIP